MFPSIDARGYPNLQAAINAAVVADSEVHLPAGVYDATGLMYAPGNNKNIGIRGDGFGTVIRAVGDGPVLTLDAGDSNFQRQLVSDLRFDMNGYDATAINYFGQGQHGMIQRVSIGGDCTNVSRGLIELHGLMVWLEHVNIRATGAAFGLKTLAPANGLWIVNCEFNFMDIGVDVLIGTAVHIAQSRFEKNAESAVRFGVGGGQVLSASIERNRIEDCNAAILLHGQSTGNRSESIAVKNNYLTGIKDGDRALEIRRCQDVEVIHNYFVGMHGLPSYPVGEAIGFTSLNNRIVLRGNSTQGSRQVGSEMTGASGLFAEDNAYANQESLDW